MASCSREGCQRMPEIRNQTAFKAKAQRTRWYREVSINKEQQLLLGSILTGGEGEVPHKKTLSVPELTPKDGPLLGEGPQQQPAYAPFRPSAELKEQVKNNKVVCVHWKVRVERFSSLKMQGSQREGFLAI